MDTPKILNIAYKCVCLIIIFCIVPSLFLKYYLNEDTSVINLKPFNKTPKHKLPAFTFCLRSYEDGLYTNQELLSKMGLNKSYYHDILMGKIEDAHLQNITSIRFETATIKLEQYLRKFKVTDPSNKKLINWKQDET